MKRVQGLIGIVVVLLILALIGIAILSIRGLTQVNQTYQNIVHSEIPKLKLLQEITLEVSTIQRKLLVSVIEANNTDQETKVKVNKAIMESRQKIKGYFEEFEPLIRTEEGKKLLEALKQSRLDYIQKSDRLLELTNAGKAQEAYAYNNSMTLPSFNHYQEALEELVVQVGNLAEKKGEEASEEATTIKNEDKWISIVSVIMGVVGGVVALGVLKQSVKKLSDISQSIEEGSSQTASASGQVSSSSQSLAQGASEQAASLEETGASMEEMTSMTKRNSEGARTVKELASQATSAGDKGVLEMSLLKSAMTEVQTSGNEISKIIKTIDEIAFQTNILALNAAVEAARAGEAGAGFSVVAEEVRNLAQRSAIASRETSEKIEGAIQKAKHGSELTERVSKSLEEIVDRSKKVYTLVEEIVSASDEQSRGITQINIAIGQMDKVTQSSAATAEETAAASEELHSQAITLKSLVEELNQVIGTAQNSDQAKVSSTFHTSVSDSRKQIPSSFPQMKRTTPSHAIPLPALSSTSDHSIKKMPSIDMNSFADMT